MPEECKISLKQRGICVIIPTYNNAGTVADVVSRAQAYCEDVFVVLDGCTDDTQSRLEALPQQPRCIVIGRNKGKGNALKEGFRAAREAGFAYAITLDADGQHYPEDIPLFLEANRQHPGALIVGRRQGLKEATRSEGSRFANAFSNFWFCLQTGIPLQDTQTGYRLYPLKKTPRLISSRYEAELALLVLSAWKGVDLVNQDVRVYYPPREERVSHFRPIADFTRITILNVFLCILAVIYGWPRTLLRWIIRILKSLFVFLFYVLVMAFLVMPGVWLFLKIGPKTEEKKEKLHRFICRFAKMGTRLFGLVGNPFTVAGEADFSRPAIITCNHQSHLDLLPMLALTPKLVILTADWVWNNPLYGFIIREADFLPASEGLEAITPRLAELVKKGYCIAIYPESTRSLDGSIGRFHQGAFYLADVLGVDILPTIIYGAGRALPKHGRVLKRWPIRLVMDGRIGPEELKQKGETYKSQASWLRKYYKERYTEIADKVDQTIA